MWKCLLTLTAAGAAALFLGAAPAAATAVGSPYQWQQPGTAPANTPQAQPQLSFAPVPPSGIRYSGSSAYVWSQPGTAPVNVPDAQPW
jgi:hypothetical protein